MTLLFVHILIKHTCKKFYGMEEVYFTIYEKMLAESKRLEARADALRLRIKELPDGDIFCSRNGRHYKWYRTDGKKQVYIPKKDRRLAEKLAVKKYLSFLLQDFLQEMRAINFYLKHHRMGKAETMLNGMPEYQELLNPYFQPLSREFQNWMNSPYEHNMKYQEHLRHRTGSGRIVRSKSEALIDMVLSVNQIPFRYECALHLGAATVYPDFTIRHPKTGQTYYWEHFGRMDDPEYCKNVCAKLQLYTTNGIIPSVRLITTYETQENPLATDQVEKIVKEYFL